MALVKFICAIIAVLFVFDALRSVSGWDILLIVIAMCIVGMIAKKLKT